MWVTREYIDMLIKEEIVLLPEYIEIAKVTPCIIADILDIFLARLPFMFEPYSEDDIMFGMYPDQIEQIKLYDLSSLTREEITQLIRTQVESMLLLLRKE